MGNMMFNKHHVHEFAGLVNLQGAESGVSEVYSEADPPTI
jgi:hypothetical protein